MNLLSRLLNRLGDIFFAPIFLPLWRKRLSGKTAIYLYHRIGEVGDHPFLDKGNSPITSLEEFCADIRFLQKQGAKFIRVCDIESIKADNNDFNAVVTFDDGFSSNFGEVLDYLDEQGIPSTLFQVTSMTKNKPMNWEHQLYLLGTLKDTSEQFWSSIKQIESSISAGDFSLTRQLVSTQQILEICSSLIEAKPELNVMIDSLVEELYPSLADIQSAHSNGHEIASHGHQHYFRPRISEQEFKEDLLKSKQWLDELACEPSSFSYPFNEYLEGDRERVSEYFKYTATVDSGILIHAQASQFVKGKRHLPRNTWPGKAKSELRRNRWLLTGRI